MQLNKLACKASASSVARWLGEGLLIYAVIIGTACREAQRVEPPVTKARPEVKRALGYFSPVAGTSHLRAPITSVSSGGYSSSYDRDNEAYNYVFFNSADESTLTLLPT